ncbi:hypothetical protein FBT96_18695 [Rhodobacter capsulatus]|uniref:Uncharacterized protein n=1 Tax=Rhodobacter capsulatus TaxID=1061 RepID=A0A4U1JLD0_RHOCA|nr:hypothetical protein [Rhodobacter capsulatus]TKD13876.1 hypothetical protein FBT96_18695 [Rhodobacter capsulatus]
MTGPFADIIARLEAGILGHEPLPRLDRLLAMAEEILVTWLARCGAGAAPGMVEGSLLLSLHRQGCRCRPGFDASRELCREIVARRNVALLYPEEAARAHADMAEKVLQLALFVAEVMPRGLAAEPPGPQTAPLCGCVFTPGRAPPDLREVAQAF